MSTLNKFVSKFCQWCQKGAVSRASYRKVAPSLRRAVTQELPKRDGQAALLIRGLEGSDGLRCTASSPTVVVTPAARGGLACGLLTPAWSKGWRGAFSDEHVQQVITDFLFFAEQYVARSRIANVLGALACTYHRACDFRPGLATIYPPTSYPPPATLEQALEVERLGELAWPNQRESRSRREREMTAWLQVLNCLDPFIHRAVYQYAQAVDLDAHNFTEEAITRLDNLVSVAAQFTRQRLQAVADDQRDQMFQRLGITAADQDTLRRLYSVRCYFGAHPSPSKWWDFFEIYDSDFEEFFLAARTLLLKLCQAEAAHRLVDPDPSLWSDWFHANALMLWDTVWFERLPG